MRADSRRAYDRIYCKRGLRTLGMVAGVPVTLQLTTAASLCAPLGMIEAVVRCFTFGRKILSAEGIGAAELVGGRFRMSAGGVYASASAASVPYSSHENYVRPPARCGRDHES